MTASASSIATATTVSITSSSPFTAMAPIALAQWCGISASTPATSLSLLYLRDSVLDVLLLRSLLLKLLLEDASLARFENWWVPMGISFFHDLEDNPSKGCF